MNTVSSANSSVPDVTTHITGSAKKLLHDPITAFCKPTSLTTDMRRQMIAVKAYYRAESRGFAPGHEVEDWLSAQAEVNQFIFSSYL